MPYIELTGVSAGPLAWQGIRERLSLFLPRVRPAVPVSLNHISLQLFSSDSLALVGQDPCGADALAQLIAGRLPPQGGHRLVQGRVALVQEPEQMLVPFASWKENVLLYGLLRGYTRKQCILRMSSIATFIEAENHGNQPAASLPELVRRRLCFALGLCFEPDILVMCAPLSGLGLRFEKEARTRIRTLLRFGCILLYRVRYPYEAQGVCSQAVVFHGNSMGPMLPLNKLLLPRFQEAGLKAVAMETAQELVPNPPLPPPETQQAIGTLLLALRQLNSALLASKKREKLLQEQISRHYRTHRGFFRRHFPGNNSR